MLVVALAAIAYFALSKKSGERAVESTREIQSKNAAAKATGNPDDAVNAILQNAGQEQAAASQNDEVDIITSSDENINAFEGVYNENEF